MPFSRGDYGDDKPSRPAGTKRIIRKTTTEETEKRGNTAASKSRSNVHESRRPLPRKPMRETSTDQPLAAPQRSTSENNRVARKQGAKKAASRDDEEEEAMVAQPTMLARTESDESNLLRRERVIAHTVFTDDSSYVADQRQKRRERMPTQRETPDALEEDYKVSLQQKQQDRADLLATKNGSGEKFVDEHEVDPLTVAPRPPTRQSNILALRPGAYQGQPGEGFRRNASNWKEPFLSNQTSNYSELPSYSSPDLGDQVPPTFRSIEEDLVQALPVTDEDSLPDLADLEVAKLEQEIKGRRQRQKQLWLVGVLIGFFLLVGLALITGLVIRLRLHSETHYSTSQPNNASTSTPILIEGLSNPTIQTIQNDPTSPQAQAYNWFVNDSYRFNYDALRARQRLALATLFFATEGEAWSDAHNWLDYETDECTWFASHPDAILQCNEEGLLLGLELANNTLNGTIPGEIGLLSSLHVLDLADNTIQGTLPSELGLLTDLRMLRINNNNLNGSLPTEFGLLSQMETVHVYDNNLEGLLPSEIGLMTSMVDWFMSRTNIGGGGPIPTEIGQWTNLNSLRTWNTDIGGPLPSEMGLLTNLTYLAMHNGNLRGTIPTEFGLLTSLTYMQLDVHNLSGPIPSELGQLQDIAFLSFGGNQLTATLPSELGQLPRLQGLRFYQNKLTGTLPTELGNLGYLQRLELDDNRISGSIPSELSRAPFLVKLFLAKNQLTGSLPSELGDLAYLYSMLLNNNPRLGGSIPVEWGFLASQGLKQLYLDNAAITGSIPDSLCTIDRFEIDCNQDVCGCSCQVCH